mmetsp:Transcript_26554/g.63227  ORF Transcript_26554/g.63227 Transcript_26554/m.63227 type:complete len:230 (-) Transcript_26554:131-820(-)
MMIPERNGILQPHASICSSLNVDLRPPATNPPIKVPRFAPAMTNEPYNPHLDFGCPSRVKTNDDINCPPTLRPCIIRTISNSNIAGFPICLYVGRHPMRVVATAMRNIEISNAYFLPRLSPMYPITNPPIGLIKKAQPKTAKLSRIERSSAWPGGKNTSPMMSEKNPNTAKSYHSNTLPATPARVFNVSWHDDDDDGCGGGGEGGIGNDDDDADPADLVLNLDADLPIT